MRRRLAHFWNCLWRRTRLERDEELCCSFEMVVARFEADGMTPAQARRADRV